MPPARRPRRPQIRAGEPRSAAPHALSRRAVLGLLAAAGFAGAALRGQPAGAAEMPEPTSLVLHDGWILRSDDLARLDIA